MKESKEVRVKRIVTVLVLALLVLSTTSAWAAEGQHVSAALAPVGGSGVTGMVQIEQLPGGGTNINVVAFGLQPGTEYLSLYYENHTCELEPYSEDDVIGTYAGNAAGMGSTHGQLDDDLDEVMSVSVRRASDFSLVACADTQP
jgi:hypothetical protein